MPREIRPWYRPHIDSFCGAVLLFSSLGCWGGIEILRHRSFAGVYLFVPSALAACFAVIGLWRGRHPWIYETHNGRKIKVTPHFRDEHDVWVDGRCARVHTEMLTGGFAVDFSSIREWQNEPMAWEERVDVLNILLEDFEAGGTPITFYGANIPDTPQVRIAQERWKREFLRQ